MGEYLKYFALPLFFILYLANAIKRNKLFFSYLILLWFIIPWIVFATYKGEISDYYFSINRFIALMILAYIIYRIWNLKQFLIKITVVLVLFIYCLFNLINFLQWGSSQSYIYYYLMRQKGINVYWKVSKIY